MVHIPKEQHYKSQAYAEFIGKKEATVRAVDDSDLYLYTKDERLVREIKLRYDGVSVSSGQLESFVYPE